MTGNTNRGILLQYFNLQTCTFSSVFISGKHGVMLSRSSISILLLLFLWKETCMGCCSFCFLPLLTTARLCVQRGHRSRRMFHPDAALGRGQVKLGAWIWTQSSKPTSYLLATNRMSSLMLYLLSFICSLLFEVTVLSLWCLLPRVFLLILIMSTGEEGENPPCPAVLLRLAGSCVTGTVLVLSRAQKVRLLLC